MRAFVVSNNIQRFICNSWASCLLYAVHMTTVCCACPGWIWMNFVTFSSRVRAPMTTVSLPFLSVPRRGCTYLGLHQVTWRELKRHRRRLTDVGVVSSKARAAVLTALCDVAESRRTISHVARCYPRRDLRRAACLGAEGSTSEWYRL